MSEQLPPLAETAPELAELVKRAGSVPLPPTFAAEAWARLDLAPLASAHSAAGASAAATTSTGAVGTKLVLAAVISAAIGAAGGVAATRWAFPPEPPPAQVVVKEVIKEVRVEVPIRVEVPAEAPQSPPPGRRSPRPADANAVTPEVPAPAPKQAEVDRQLREERWLLEVARTALARGDGQQALNGLAEHQAKFPSSRLSEERDALRVTALEALGRRAEAQAEAARFLQRYPDSLVAPALKKVLTR